MLQSLAVKEMHTCPPVTSTLMEVGRRKCHKILKGNFIHCMASSKNLPKGTMTTTKATLTSVAEWIESRTFHCGNVPANAEPNGWCVKVKNTSVKVFSSHRKIHW